MVKDNNDLNAWQRVRALFSMNDPRWGRGDGKENTPDSQQNRPPDREGGGPPDLDELWRDFNRRLNALFGRRSGGGSPSGEERGGTSGKLGILIILAILVAAWLASGIFIVQEGQAGVVLRFGRYVYTTAPGIQWRMPYPFEADETVNMSQVRSIEIGRNGTIRAANLKDSSMLTADGNIIDVRFAVQYRIKDASAFLFNNADAEDNVAQAAETAVREIVGKSKMDYVLYEGREEVAAQLAQSIQKILDSYDTGILVTSVTMQNVQPPEQVQAAFDDAVKAGQDRERQKNEAQAYANDVVPRAKGAAARLIEEAQGYKARVIAEAEGNAQRFKEVQAEYAKAPAVTRERMYLDTMQQIYSRSTKVLIDGRANNNMIYLPLDKLVEGAVRPRAAETLDAASQPSGDASGSPATPAAQADANVANAREAFRSRARSQDLH